MLSRVRWVQAETERGLPQPTFQGIQSHCPSLAKALIVHSFRHSNDEPIFAVSTPKRTISKPNEMPCNVAMIPCYLYPYYPSSYDHGAIPLIYGALTLQCQPTTVNCSCEKKRKKKTHKRQCQTCRDLSKPIQYLDYYQWQANLPI